MKKGDERILMHKIIEGFKSLSSQKSGSEPQSYFFIQSKDLVCLIYNITTYNFNLVVIRI